jgi:transposase
MKSDTIRSKFYELYTAGVTYTEIVGELGVSKRTASNWAKEMGLPRRRGGPSRKKWMPDEKHKIG